MEHCRSLLSGPRFTAPHAMKMPSRADSGAVRRRNDSDVRVIAGEPRLYVARNRAVASAPSPDSHSR
jgi:hypothetical protein